MLPNKSDSDLDLFQKEFSEKLFLEMKSNSEIYHLDGTNGLFQTAHPSIIKCKILFNQHTNHLPLPQFTHGWHMGFEVEEEPEMKIYGGFPFEIYQFLMDRPQKAILNFYELGKVVVSKTPLSPHQAPSEDSSGAPSVKLEHLIMAEWLNYALSQELWGDQGKWMRFHHRLDQIFIENNISLPTNQVGLYSLRPEFFWLRKHGFNGKIIHDRFQLILPWDFPLSALVKLEAILLKGDQ